MLIRILGQVLVAADVKDGQDRRGEHHHAGDRPNQAARDHEPAGQETEVRVDRAADPLKEAPQLAFHRFSLAIRVGDDQHRYPRSE